MSTCVTILISGSQKIISKGQLLCGQTGTSQEYGSTALRNLKEQDIILYGIHPNTTHFLQPLDVAVFGPLKKVWKKYVREWQETHDSVLSINTFVSCVVPMYYANVTQQNVVSGFWATGLHPFDSSAHDYTKIRTAQTYIPNIAIFEEIDQGRLALV